MDLKERVRSLPACPGVYLMKDSAGRVLYVGKSKNLKSRVSSYFQASKSHPPKVLKLVKHLKSFDYIITDTEFEAFMLECRLIKELSPQYNRIMNNHRAYCYVRIGINEKCPDLSIVAEPDKSDGNIWFGPYTSKNTVTRALQGIRETCRLLCSCTSQKPSTCLNYSLGLCLGTCSPDFPREQYLSMLERVADLLNGSDKSIIEEMAKTMERASMQLDFECAAKYRDYIRAVNYMLGKTKVVEFTKRNRNILVLERIDDERVKCFLIKGNRLLISEMHEAKENEALKLLPVLRNNAEACFSRTGAGKPPEIGRADIDEAQIIYSYLNNKQGGCRHIVIADSWLKPQNSFRMDKAIGKLLSKL